jgi:hypothetical protein
MAKPEMSICYGNLGEVSRKATQRYAKEKRRKFSLTIRLGKHVQRRLRLHNFDLKEVVDATRAWRLLAPPELRKSKSRQQIQRLPASQNIPP